METRGDGRQAAQYRRTRAGAYDLKEWRDLLGQKCQSL